MPLVLTFGSAVRLSLCAAFRAGNEKMTSRNQHVVPHPNGWAVQSAGGAKATAVYETQGQAIERARDIARNQESELLIHGENGRIRARNSYGNDEFPPRG
jgi:hypothetical protein